MNSQEEAEEAEAEDDPPIIFGRGTWTAVFFVLDNHAVLRHETKTKLLSFGLLDRLPQQVRRSDRRERSYGRVAGF